MDIKLESAFRDLFSTPEKWMTILLLAVCMLIPVVGPMVISGYLIRRFASVRRGFPAVDFKFDYFGEYLQIGLWPFLCSMVVSVVATPLFMLFRHFTMAGRAAPRAPVGSVIQRLFLWANLKPRHQIRDQATGIVFLR